jgi:Tol biopolymer transport system component
VKVLVRGMVLAVGLTAFWAAPGWAAPATTVTPDGSAHVFHTQEALLPADTDTAFDVYVRRGGTNELITGGTATNAFARAISADGERVVFVTDAALVPADTDATTDVYAHEDGQDLLVSGGTPGVAAGFTHVGDVSEDGGRIIFQASGPLVPQDADSEDDIYRWDDLAVTLVTASPAGQTRELGHFYRGASRDGTRIFAETVESLVGSDADLVEDVYEHSGGTAKLVSTGSIDLHRSGSTHHHTAEPSPDGSSYVFLTTAALEPGDTNSTLDLYQRRNGRTRLLTANRLGLAPSCPVVSSGPGPLPCTIWASSQTADGGTVVFGAGQRLASSDTDNEYDVYRRSGSSLEHVASGGDGWISPDGARMVFASTDRLTAADTDSFVDLYSRAGGVTTLLTPNTPADNLRLLRASEDLTRVFFLTQEGALPADTDNGRDVYESVGGTLRLVTSGPSDDHAAGDSAGQHFDLAAASADGRTAFFESSKRLVPEDADSSRDLYKWSDGVTTLVTG